MRNSPQRDQEKEEGKECSENILEQFAERSAIWIGSVWSLVFHTIFFVLIFLLPFVGFHFENVLLVLTTLVSLEAIYLAIFIQMSVNRESLHLKDIKEDMDEISEDVEEISEDVEEIQKDVDEISEDVEEMSEEREEDDIEGEGERRRIEKKLERIEILLKNLSEDVEILRKSKK